MQKLIPFTVVLMAFFVLSVGTGIASAGSPPLYSLDEALHLGAVDMLNNPWGRLDYQREVSRIHLLGPGVINRFGFMYGGPNQQFLDSAGALAQQFRAKLPRTLLGTALPEHLDFSHGPVTLRCGGSLAAKTFDLSKMVTVKFSPTLGWIDITKQSSQDYLLCLGELFIDQGFTMIQLENAQGVASANPANPSYFASSLQSYRNLQAQLNGYAQRKGLVLYWGSNPEVAEALHLDYAYTPARVYTTAWPNAWQNKILRPGIGVGYSYVLSTQMISDMKKALGTAPTRLLFYVDNYDGVQDDLARMLELDATNRRFMLEESARVAKENGVFFLPNLTHCEGCIAAAKLGDKCSLMANGMTGYDAIACGDISAIQDSLQSLATHTITTRVDFANEWGVCSSSIRARGDCRDNCIYHAAGQADPLAPLAGAAGLYGYLTYHLDENGYCTAAHEEKLDTIQTTVDSVGDWAVCSKTIQQSAQCRVWNNPNQMDACVWHHGTNLEFRLSGGRAKVALVPFRRDPTNGNCFSTDEIIEK